MKSLVNGSRDWLQYSQMIAPDSRKGALCRVLCGEPSVHRSLNICFYLFVFMFGVLRVVTKPSGVGYTRDHLDRTSRTKVKISCNTFQQQVYPFNRFEPSWMLHPKKNRACYQACSFQTWTRQMDIYVFAFLGVAHDLGSPQPASAQPTKQIALKMES